MRSITVAALAYCLAMRAFELVLSRRNQARVVGRGGRVVPDAGMNWIVLVHSLWFVAIIAEERTLGPSFEQLPLQALFAALFVGAELTRFWCISALGDRWNIRIVIHPGEGLVCSGPYRYLKHPNYVAATVLIGAMPLALGLPYTALASVPLKLLAVISRVRVENKRLAEC